MLARIYIEALLVDPHLAAAIWELLDAGVITVDYAEGAWQLIATERIPVIDSDA